MHEISIFEVCEAFNLQNVLEEIDITKRKIRYPKINRIALQLTGFFEYFDAQRMQIIGKVEYTYLERMTPEARENILKELFGYDIPCVIFCRGLIPFPELKTIAKECGIPLLLSNDATTDFTSEISRWLKVKLAPRVQLHGVLVDVYGEGVLITGESGIGKSEMALELIKRGHRLVADDAVEIRKVSTQTLVGSCPENIRFYIEVRGIGIINVRRMFGVQAIKETQNIDLVLKLETWDRTKEYDRLGLDADYIDILGNSVVLQTIPIRPGRNLAMIGEAAAVNHRQKKMGFNAAEELLASTKQTARKNHIF